MSLEGVQFHLANTIDSVGELKRWMGERRAGVLAVDTETTGLSPHGPDPDRIRLIQLGDEMAGWAVPWDGWGGAAVEVLKAYAAENRVVFHNAKFDMSFINRDEEVIPWRHVDDTRSIAWLADPTSSTALKPLAARYVDPLAAGMQAQLDRAMNEAGWTFETVPMDFQPYWVYGALDTVLTSRMWGLLAHRVLSDPDLARAYQLELSVLPVIQRMEAKGARVDPEYAAGVSRKLSQYVNHAQAWANAAHSVSLTANQQVVRRLLEMGQPLTKLTKSGNAYALDKEVLDDLIINGVTAEVRELITVARTVRRFTKIIGAYLSHMQHSEYVFSSINPIGAPRTGRMSVTGQLALQTLPRANPDNPAAIEVRNCFIPRDGNKLVMIDFDQIELRLSGHFSADPEMIEVLSREGDVDPFTEFARRIYADPTITKKDSRRQLTKNASYADLYGAGDAKFCLTAGVPLEQGQAFRRAYHAQFPMLRQFQLQVAALAEQRLREEGQAYVRTPYGHRLVCESDKTYKLVNYLIQGTAANVMKQKLVDLDNAGLGEYLVLPVHDEAIFDVPAELADEVAHDAAKVMEEREVFRVPLPVGVDGPFDSWGAKYA